VRRANLPRGGLWLTAGLHALGVQARPRTGGSRKPGLRSPGWCLQSQKVVAIQALSIQYDRALTFCEYLPGWSNASAAHVVTPKMMGSHFSMALVKMAPGSLAGPPPAGVERFVFVLSGGILTWSGESGAKRVKLRSGGFAFFPEYQPSKLYPPIRVPNCVPICVGICVPIRVRTYRRTYPRTYRCTYTRTYRCTYPRRYVSVYLSAYVSVYLSAYVRIGVPIRVRIGVPIRVLIGVPICVRMYRCTYPRTYRCTYPPTYVSVYLSAYVSVYLSAYVRIGVPIRVRIGVPACVTTANQPTEP